MAFSNVAGRAGFVLALDKTDLDRGLPAAERQFDQSTRRMAQSASVAGDAVGMYRGGSSGIGMAGRIGMIGVAVNAGIQGLNEASKALQTTGADAFTTEGKIRNLGAALAQGDIVGGLMAIAKQPRTLRDLGLDARGAAAHLDELKTASDAFGGSATKLYQEAQLAAQGVVEIDAATKRLLNTSLGFKGPGGWQIVPGGFAGLRPSAGLPVVPAGQSILGPGAVPTPPTRVRGLPSILTQRAREAARSDDLGDDLRVARDIAAFAKRRLDLVRQEGPLMEKRRQEYQDALDKVDRAEDAIRADATRKAEERQRAAEAAATERLRKQKAAAAELLRKRKERAERARNAAEEAERQWEEVAIAMTSPSTWAEALAARSEALNARFGLQSKAAAAKTDPGLSVADIRRMQLDFLTSLQGITNQFGGNLMGGQVATNTWQTSRLMIEQNDLLRGLTRGVAHPGAKYARTELMQAFGDVGGV